MELLGTAMAEQIVASYGIAGFLSRLSDPFWFQAFGCVMRMDRHANAARLRREDTPQGRDRHSQRLP
jgi:hypothetical protein